MALNDQILKYLQEYGPSTSKELRQHTGAEKNVLSKALSLMKRGTPQRPRTVHITSWVEDAEGEARRYWRPVWAAGAKPNASKPAKKKVKRTARSQDWITRMKMSSVFTMAMKPDTIVRMRKNGIC